MIIENVICFSCTGKGNTCVRVTLNVSSLAIQLNEKYFKKMDSENETIYHGRRFIILRLSHGQTFNFSVTRKQDFMAAQTSHMKFYSYRVHFREKDAIVQ